MARVDDFREAKRLAVSRLAGRGAASLAESGEFELLGETRIRIPFLGREYILDIPDGRFRDAGDADREIPLTEQVLILHYLLPNPPPPITGRWIAYREIPGAALYHGVFIKRAVAPLTKVFGHNLKSFRTAAEKLEGRLLNEADEGWEIRPFPKTPLRYLLWAGDDEFPPDASILFDASISDIFTPEDAAWLASFPVYRLIALAKV